MTTTASPGVTRDHGGATLPAAGVYDLDKAHTTVEFVARHLMISKVRGRFDDFSGTVTIGEVPEESHVEVTIDARSVSTNEPQRDEHLRSADFFDVERFPRWSFRSTGVELTGDGRFRLTGDLTVRDVTKPVVLDGEFEGAGATPWGTSAIGFTAATEIDRDEWGLTWNQALETGGVLVGKRVRVELSVEAVPAAGQAAA
jgi:polyisoprenoid-binding protein YceI